MARVYIPSQTWSPVIFPDNNNYKPKSGASVQIKVMGTATNATHYSAASGGSSATTALIANSDGTLPGRWIEEGEYDIVVDGAAAQRVPATGGTSVKIMKEAALSPDDYGALGNGASATEDTAGWAALLAAMPTLSGAKTGRIQLPPNRRYKINAGGMLNFDDSSGVEIRGAGGMSHLAGRPMLEWLGGAGSGPMIRYASAGGFRLIDVVVAQSDNAYNDDLVMGGRSAAVLDCFYPHFERVYFAGISGSTSARSLLNINSGIGVKVKGCQFISAAVGLRGYDGNFTTAVTIDDGCFFNRCTTAGIYNPDEGWTIAGNAFEPKLDGSPCGISFDGSHVALGLQIFGNWHGDITNTGSPAGSWIDVCARGLEIVGNRLHLEVAGVGHRAIYLRDVRGGRIAANNFSSGSGGPVAIDFQLRSGNPCDGITVDSNRFTSITQIANEANLTSGEYVNNVGLTDKKIGRPQALPSYTTATLPTAATYTGHVIYVSDAAAGSRLQYSNGSTWVAAG